MSRNKIMGAILALSVGLLVTAVIGTYRIFSYLSAILILMIFASAAIEGADHEFDLGPYNGLIAFFGILFGIGLTGIWLLWQPGTTDYNYIFGLPASTFTYMTFLWLLPALGPIYYAMVIFPKIGSEDTVEEILADAQQVQSTTDFPLSSGLTESDEPIEATEGGQ